MELNHLWLTSKVLPSLFKYSRVRIYRQEPWTSRLLTQQLVVLFLSLLQSEIKTTTCHNKTPGNIRSGRHKIKTWDCFFKLLFIVFNHISTALFVNMWGLGDLFVCKVVKVIVVGGVTVVTTLSQRERLCECFPRCCLCDVMQRSAIVKLRRRHREQGRRKTRTRARNNNNPKIPKKKTMIKCYKMS